MRGIELDSTFGMRLSRALAVIAIIGSVAFIASTALRWPFRSNGLLFQVLYAASIGLGALTYLSLKPLDQHTRDFSPRNVRVLRIAQATLGFVCAGAIILVLDGSFYVKPPIYYGFVALWGTSLIGVTIVSHGASARYRVWLLCQTIALAGTVLYSSPAINPYLIGPDTYWHFNRISHIVESHHLAKVAGHYYYYFVFHLVSTVAIVLAGVSTTAFSLLTVLWGLAIIPAGYVLARTILRDRRAALLAMQLLALNTLYIFGISNKSPTYLGFLFVFLAVYIVFTSDGLSTVQAWVCFIVLAIGAFFIHLVTALELAVLLGVHLGYVWAYDREELRGIFDTIGSQISRIDTETVMVPFFSYTAAVIAYHIFVHTRIFRRIVLILFSEGDTTAILTGQQPLRVIEVAQYGVGFLGLLLVVLLTAIAGLDWLRSLAPNRTQTIVWIGLLNVLGIGYLLVGPAGGTLRLVLSALVIAVIPAAGGLIMLVENRKSHSSIHYGVVLVLVVALALAGPMSYLTWDGNEVFNDEIETPDNFVRTELLATYELLTALPEGSNIAMDGRSAVYLFNGERGIKPRPEHLGVTCINCGTDLHPDDAQQLDYVLVNRPRWKSQSINMGAYPNSGVVYTNGPMELIRVDR